MRTVRYTASLAIKLRPAQRLAIEALAAEKSISLGEAARELLSVGIDARGIKC